MNRRVPGWLLAVFLAVFLAMVPGSRAAQGAPPPTDLPGLKFDEPFFPGTSYHPNVPSPETLLGFPPAERAATADQIELCLKSWAAAAPDRTRLVEYARSHENRPLHYLVITAPANLARLDTLRTNLARLANPRLVTPEEVTTLTHQLPAVAWLAYTIHGDETEGSDAALVLIHHLLAAEDPEVERLLQELIVIIDPLMNPDGRDRFLKMIAEHRGTSPNVDDQSLLHRGYWPYGRGNHYLFDLNRDWILCRHPETRGRVRAVHEWNPQLFVDAHGMGSQDTHLFSPPRPPINPHIPAERERWMEQFGGDQAHAFDQHRLLYYNGEWHEEWYPGYSDAWASYRGAIGILYEQARVAEDAVRRPEGRLLSYRESVRHHLIGSMANLKTLQTHRRELLQYFFQSRKDALNPNGPYATRTFAIPPSPNLSRFRDLVELLLLQGFEIHQLDQELTVARAADQLGHKHPNLILPRGTILAPTRQPLGRALASVLEFDPRFSNEVLADERHELLRTGHSRIYDVTTWNLTMLYGLTAYELPIDLPPEARPFTAKVAPSPVTLETIEPPVAWILDGADDRSVAAAARLMERGIEVRAALKSFRLGQHDYARGSIVITPLDNRTITADLDRLVRLTAAELGLSVHLATSGQGPGELPDLGGEFFRRLEPPRLAILGRDQVSINDFGASWYAVDQLLGIRHSHLPSGAGSDLRRYNVLLIPDGSASALNSNRLEQLRAWVREGGTLIAVAGTAATLADPDSSLSAVRRLPDVLEHLANYEITVLREWLAQQRILPSPDSIWNQRVTATLDYPWPTPDADYPDVKELKRRDAWQKLFMPEGVFLASRVDTNHWLTFGCDRRLPILVGGQEVLMAAEGVETPIRYGWLNQLPPSTPPEETASPANPSTAAQSSTDPKETEENTKKDTPRIGWCILPPNTEMELRMSGLLWPEAVHRLANGAYLTRESLGGGQVILFATPPAFRTATQGTLRLLLNAIVFGPGCGSAPQVIP